MAIPTQPRTNMFMKTCQPGIQPRSTSPPSRERPIARGGGKPPGKAPAGQEEIGHRPLPQLIEKDTADGHQDDKGNNPEPVQEGEVDHASPLGKKRAWRVTYPPGSGNRRRASAQNEYIRPSRK